MDPTEQPTPARARRAFPLTLLAVLLATALAALFWFDARQRIAATEEQLARRLRDIENDARDARAVAQQAQEALREAQGRLGQLESRVAESQSRQLALEALYQDLSRNRDELQLAEIEQILSIASQQLQLAGNVRAALLALQLADQRLARADRPQFSPIRRAVEGDIERLKATPTVDLPAMSMRIDTVIGAVDSLPLALEERSQAIAPATPAPPADSRFLVRLGAELWHELSQLVVVRRIGPNEPPLLPPSQAYFARENLRLRLLDARASLLIRDEAGYREDLRAASAWIERYFDPQSKRTADALAQLKSLSAASISFDLPTLNESLDAVRSYKARHERKSH